MVGSPETGIGLRLATGYRALGGTIGGAISGSDLSSVEFTLGLVFANSKKMGGPK
jgi:hypothetical protein